MLHGMIVEKLRSASAGLYALQPPGALRDDGAQFDTTLGSITITQALLTHGPSLNGAGAAGRVIDTAGIALSGGTFAVASGSSEGAAAIVTAGIPLGTNTVGLGSLTLSANSTLDFDSLGNSTLLVFTGFTPGAFTLNIANWTNATFDGTLNSGLAIDDRFVVQQDLAAAGLLNSISLREGRRTR